MKNILKKTMVAAILFGIACTFPAKVIAQTGNAPVAVCQDITKMLNANGTLNVNPEELDGGSFDLEGPVTFSADINYLYCEHLGVNSVTLLVSDNEGYVSVCTAYVTVNDLITPNAFCKDLSVTLDDNDQASISFSDLDNGSTDNCSIASMNLSKSDFTDADLGFNNIVMTVIDESGNSNDCVSVVQIVEQSTSNPFNILAALTSPTPEEYDIEDSDKGSEISMNLFPNPALQGQTTIALGNMVKGQKEITVTLYDRFGVAIRYERHLENDIEAKIKMNYLDTLTTGVYTINVDIDGKAISKQLVVR